MFGAGNKITVDKDLLERIKQISELAGFASHEEFIHAVLEREVEHFKGDDSDEAITEKLKGLGYIS